jgi:hypothetical protein
VELVLEELDERALLVPEELDELVELVELVPEEFDVLVELEELDELLELDELVTLEELAKVVELAELETLAELGELELVVLVRLVVLLGRVTLLKLDRGGTDQMKCVVVPPVLGLPPLPAPPWPDVLLSQATAATESTPSAHKVSRLRMPKPRASNSLRSLLSPVDVVQEVVSRRPNEVAPPRVARRASSSLGLGSTDTGVLTLSTVA